MSWRSQAEEMEVSNDLVAVRVRVEFEDARERLEEVLVEALFEFGYEDVYEHDAAGNVYDADVLFWLASDYEGDRRDLVYDALEEFAARDGVGNITVSFA